MTRKRKRTEPADEPMRSVLIHVWLPAGASLVLALVSVALDLSGHEGNWSQRAGAVLVAVGAYIAFHESQWHERYVPTESGGVRAYWNPEIWYKWLALGLGLVGTVLWGYGDLLL
jgi:hypothetical protein